MSKLNFPPTNRDSGPWKELSCKDGLRLVEVPDFETFSKFVNLGFGHKDCSHIWREQRRAEWQIVSSLSRYGKPELDHLFNFRNAVARCSNIEYEISDQDSESDRANRLRLWALGQHHGLDTPLIDFTEFPYIALFFAFAEPGPEAEQVEHRAVFAIDWSVIMDLNFHITETDGMAIFKAKLDAPPYSEEFKEQLVELGLSPDSAMLKNGGAITPDVAKQLCSRQFQDLKKKQLRFHRSLANENRRIHSQGGVHVYTPVNESVEDWIQANVGRCERPPLTKILVPNAHRNEILKCLNKMNVNYLTLFPDLEGAAKHCNLALRERQLGLGIRAY